MNEEETELNPDWFPGVEELEEYQARDAELARSNVHVILRASARPLSLREIKDSCLHNPSTVDTVCRLEFLAGRIVQDTNGRLSSV